MSRFPTFEQLQLAPTDRCYLQQLLTEQRPMPNHTRLCELIVAPPLNTPSILTLLILYARWDVLQRGKLPLTISRYAVPCDITFGEEWEGTCCAAPILTFLNPDPEVSRRIFAYPQPLPPSLTYRTNDKQILLIEDPLEMLRILYAVTHRAEIRPGASPYDPQIFDQLLATTESLVGVYTRDANPEARSMLLQILAPVDNTVWAPSTFAKETLSQLAPLYPQISRCLNEAVEGSKLEAELGNTPVGRWLKELATLFLKQGIAKQRPH